MTRIVTHLGLFVALAITQSHAQASAPQQLKDDFLYAVSASRDYDPSAKLRMIQAPVMYVNSADDFINPPELGIAERSIQQVKKGKFVLIPASEKTHGHGTHTWAAIWEQYLKEVMEESGAARQ
jgi:homoserine O-acetyltransferase/O-succinyltransferase